MLRIPTVKVRVGDYIFDNTNHLYSDAYTGSRYDPDQLPLENDYRAFRQVLWLATDRAYKTAEEAIARKRSSLKNMNVTEQLPDFSKAPPVQAVLPMAKRNPVDESFVEGPDCEAFGYLRRLSAGAFVGDRIADLAGVRLCGEFGRHDAANSGGSRVPSSAGRTVWRPTGPRFATPLCLKPSSLMSFPWRRSCGGE